MPNFHAAKIVQIKWRFQQKQLPTSPTCGAMRDLKSSEAAIALGMSSVVKFCRHTVVADHSGAGGRDGQRIGHGARRGGRGADCLIAVAVCASLECPLPVAPRGDPSIAHSPLPPRGQSAVAMAIQIQTQRNYA